MPDFVLPITYLVALRHARGEGININPFFWSPDGRSILFDRFQPHGGDVWAIEES